MGPLDGYRILEIAGIGPGPFCAMVLSDLGAEVVRIDRKAYAGRGSKFDVLNRGRRSLGMDLKRPEAVEAVLDMVERADGLIEGFRPGVMERLGLGPDVCLERNPRLVFGRMTGWGQNGTIAHAAGHDINYIALVRGPVDSIGQQRRASPVPPLNLVGDFGGGGMLSRVRCRGRALLERSRQSGQGTGRRRRHGRTAQPSCSPPCLRRNALGYRHVAGRHAGLEHARHRRTLLRRLRVFADGEYVSDRLDRAAVLLDPAGEDWSSIRPTNGPVS